MGKKQFTRALLILCAAMITGGCGQNAESTASVNSSEINHSEASDSSYGTVTIQNGSRTVTFTQMPQKVLCCHLYAAENMVMLGLEDYIVGKNVPANAAEAPLPELADKFKDIPEVERSNENAVALGTDLMIGQVSAFKDTAWGSYEQFETEGINCQTINEVYTDIENLGKIFKVEDRAAALIDEIQSQISEIQDAVASIPQEERITAFVLDTFNGNEIYTTSSGLESNLIELAGGINAVRGMSDSRWFNTSIETLVEADPDVIILNDYGTQTIEEKLEFLSENPALQEVTAVKDEKYLVIPLVSVMQDVRAADACRTFAEFFYPECFQ